MPKISAKFDRGHPLRGRRMHVGWVKIGDFGLITGYILAGRPLRNPVKAPRSSGHPSRNRPIFFARSRSSLVLKPLTVFAITESLSSIFHLDTTQWEKKYFLISLLHRHLTSFNGCPRVLPVVSIWNISVSGIAEKQWAILKNSIY